MTKTRDRPLCWQEEAASVAVSGLALFGLKEAPFLKHRLPGVRTGPGQWHPGSGPPKLRILPCSPGGGSGPCISLGWGHCQGLWTWSVLLPLGDGRVGQQEWHLLGESGGRDGFLLNEVSEYPLSLL